VKGTTFFEFWRCINIFALEDYFAKGTLCGMGDYICIAV
jgi:hypothetical protein